MRYHAERGNDLKITEQAVLPRPFRSHFLLSMEARHFEQKQNVLTLHNRPPSKCPHSMKRGHITLEFFCLVKDGSGRTICGEVSTHGPTAKMLSLYAAFRKKLAAMDKSPSSH